MNNLKTSKRYKPGAYVGIKCITTFTILNHEFLIVFLPPNHD